jgi:Protein of unknown function (DUF3307)
MLELTQHPESLAQGLVLLFALLIGHALGDYPLQGDFLAIHKNRHVSRGGSSTFPKSLWLHCLLSHSLIHAGLVWAITGRFVFALAEFVLHAILDCVKCEKWTSFNVDQLMHALCKAAYVVALLQGWVK